MMNFGELKIKITYSIRINHPFNERTNFGWGNIVQNSIEKQIVDVISPIDSLILEEVEGDEF